MLGLLYGVAQILQTAGLAHTPASVSGFITGMYVVCTPLLAALLLRTRITAMTWAAVALATAGLGVLTLNGLQRRLRRGDHAGRRGALRAAHRRPRRLGRARGEAMGMTIVQLLVITVVCFVATVPDGIVLPDNRGDWLSVVYMAVFAGALALAGQTWAQAHLPPTRAAIIMSMEPVFAAFFAVLLGGESVTGRMVARRR